MADKDYRKNPNDATAQEKRDENRDPLSGAPGAHPVGTGVGAAAGGAAGVAGAVAAGAAMGSAVGPVGTAVGAAVGAVVGGLAGKAVGEKVNPTVEHEYWRNNYTQRPYVAPNTTYDEYAPAYQYGWESSQNYAGKEFKDVEPNLSRDWDKAKGKSHLEWDRAKEAVRDSWNRVTHRGSSSESRQDSMR